MDKKEFADFLNQKSRSKKSIGGHERFLVDPETDISIVDDVGETRVLPDDFSLDASMNVCGGETSRRSQSPRSQRRSSSSPYSKLHVSERELENLRCKLKVYYYTSVSLSHILYAIVF